MALDLDPARLVAPLSDDAPCGEDLDAAGDIDFLNRVSHVESLLPASFFTRDDEGRPQPFDRASIDFRREEAALLALLDRSRDLRVLTLLARLTMLDRDLPGFAAALSAIAGLLEGQWEAVHPRGEGGGYELRGAVLQTIDDVPTVILPLQHVPLAQSRRHGPISFRSVMTADGEVPAREDEPAPDREAIGRALDEADPELLRGQHDTLAAAAAALARITAATVEHGGYASAVGFERLSLLVGRMQALLDRAAAAATDDTEQVPADEPARPEGRATPARTPGGIERLADASAALAAAAEYLRRQEPSSPAEVLTRQAQMLIGKSFVEVMRILVPDRAGEAVLSVGSNRGLRLTFDQLAAVPEEAGAEDGWGEEQAETPDAAPAAAFKASSRGEATGLLREVAAFFRRHEPSSPIPLLLDKAVGIADRDFLAILRDVLPETATE
ncbi:MULTISPECIES: type VI secretion system ImpA family N-terminal domain-containing protein [Methylobacterium]|uniref:ImpA N-terminal domain-containing protein n=6 Tax=Pseudomonadota TaxID=1224 RepID=A0ABQ4SVS5_9HYPH|nr:MULTISPECIES: type VI secretion system ImpA family N-terminal domain-containing protein [Methylobacterium]PIU04181.1 MAG: hypothetical protein COT56_21655 [Methylobacterium sp. CG09_land_8_20_14_0_10_71_15]PIU15068.1 MAG: hypothetical protein COT28_06000 [Methylobacterium sp. CG08_land_8_20_14_0_20_71_15]GBU17883.1 hypothetical protein AwMethylo_20980 [Methylobacterium sp.]GJE07305.1 hypothetical protein AOPFMNJM_2631 [Methylobacterium jeotgali]